LFIDKSSPKNNDRSPGRQDAMSQDARIAHIATLARRLRYGIWALVGITTLAILVLVVEGIATAQLVLGSVRLEMSDVSGATAAVVAAATLPLLALFGWLAWLCDQLLALYQRGEIFGRANAELILRAGKLIVALSVMASVIEPLAGWALSKVGAPIESWSFEPRVGTLLIGLGIVVVGHVMSLGAEMAEDQELTI
jgi:hypothetical protein